MCLIIFISWFIIVVWLVSIIIFDGLWLIMLLLFVWLFSWCKIGVSLCIGMLYIGIM